MNELRFQTEIGEDQVIRLPEGVTFPPGKVEVVILQKEDKPQDNGSIAQPRPEHLFNRLANAAERLKVDLSDLPTDLAENHDHYLYGSPKGVDQK